MESRRFSSVLIANRGEIAVRLIQGCRRLGLRTIAVYSDADREATHVVLADQAVRLGESLPSASYLAIDKLIAAAAATGADALHPGYGFLAEREDFARAVLAAGLVWIGPGPESMAAMGDKSAAKRALRAAGVPCLPGYEAEQQDDSALRAAAQALGFPIMIKAAAGGGGRGMRAVDTWDEWPEALRSARSEAQSAFGDGRLLLERVVRDARHIEIQVFGDAQGLVVHLGERECSVQRRHQKLIEEAPSPAVDGALRSRMGAAAVTAAAAVGYVGAGTVEFLLDSEGAFFFLEMNTRLQVEHAVTEAVYGVDLVEWQLRIAQGEALPLTQAQIDARRQGWAIEARLCSEDPAQGYLPQSGRVLAWRAAQGSGLRIDTALCNGGEISPHYDALQAKLIAWGADREIARARLLRALEDSVLLGVTCNRTLLARLLSLPAFVQGRYHTGLIAEHIDALTRDAEPAFWIWALVAAVLVQQDGEALLRSAGFQPDLLGWHSGGSASTMLRLRCAGQSLECRVDLLGAGRYRVVSTQGEETIDLLALDGGDLRFLRGGISLNARFARKGTQFWLACAAQTWVFDDIGFAAAKAQAVDTDGDLRAPITGRIVAVLTEPGAAVELGQTLLVLEAMKMEFQLKSRLNGRVTALDCRVGQAVQARQLLLSVTPRADTEANS